MAPAVDWILSGTYFEACNCEAACPCVFLSPPTNAECTVLVAWHIINGRFGDVKLDGLSVALAIYSPGHMMKVKWKVALYVDEKANQSQKEVLTKIFAGQVGGPPAALGPFVGEVLGVKSAAINYAMDGRKRSLVIPRIAEVDIEAIAGQGDSEVTVSNPPFIAVPGVPVVVAKSRGLRYHDYGLEWNVSEKNGYYAPFRYKGP